MRLGAGLLAASLALAACSSDDEPPEDGGPCYEGLECRVVQVPQAHAAPGGSTIGLKVIIARTSKGSAGASPIVYLTGGPGGTVESAALGGTGVKRVADAFGRDLILLEQRGNKLSEPALDCGIVDATNETTMRECTTKYAGLGYGLGAFNTVENAHDIEAVRVALGVPKVILWGGSYGGFLAQTMARLHPSSVAGMLLESSAMTGRTYRSFDQERAREPKFAAFLAWLDEACAANVRCAAEMPKLDSAKEVNDFGARVATTPFTMTTGAVFDSLDVTKRFLQLTMYAIPNAVLAVRMIHAVNHDRLGAFDDLRINARTARQHLARIITFANVNRTSNRVYDCYDSVRNWTDAGLATNTAGLYAEDERPAIDELISGLRAACAALPEPTVPASELMTPTTTDLPTLFFHGGLDWPTAVEHVTEALPNYSRARLVEVPCAGHGLQGVIPECFTSLASTFFRQADDGTWLDGDIDTSCATSFCSRSPDAALLAE